MSDPMFENSKVIQVLETPQLIETPKKVKKPRKPMSEERKEALREQLKKARETKKKKKKRKPQPLVQWQRKKLSWKSVDTLSQK